MVAAALIVYFGLNAVRGDHGLLRMIEMRAEIARAAVTLQTVQQHRQHLEIRIQALRSHRLDPDYLDERTRLMTGLIGPEDIVLIGLMRPDATHQLQAMVGTPPGILR